MRLGEIRFMHLRRRTGRYEADGKEVVDPKGGATVAVRREPNEYPGGQKHILRVAVAVCSPRDHYCKATGRAHAKAKLDDPVTGDCYALRNPDTHWGRLEFLALDAYESYHGVRDHLDQVTQFEGRR